MVTFQDNRTTRRRVKNLLLEFSDRTTAHGIPRIGMATSKREGAFWTCVVCTSLTIFIFQLCLLIARFLRFETTTQVELRFETSQFPVVTLCNINPYKNSLVREVDEMKRMFQFFEKNQPSGNNTSTPKRVRRLVSSHEHFRYKPLYARCLCPDDDGECVPFLTAPLAGEGVCICYFDKHTRSPWPCFAEKHWRSEWCTRCSPSGNCWEVLKKRQLSSHDDIQQCICDSRSHKCLAASGDRPERIWDPKYRDVRLDRYTTTVANEVPPTTTTTTTTTTAPPSTTTTTRAAPTEDEQYSKTMGFQGITDETAKVSKAQENTLFIMAEMSNETRVRLSQQKRDFILQCSFNGRQCNIEKDFKLYADPVYGNCYMFNSDSSQNRTTSRAGPIYGLSLVVYVDVDDYLPTTKASGVRLVVHSQEEYPFPDTNGYNAPTGLMSSFGLRLRKIERLPAPYGDCVHEGKTKDYIYRDQVYTLEGCYRSCFQMELIKACGCGDPRFPVPEGRRHCRVEEREKRICLEEFTQSTGGLHGQFTHKCKCTQPCHQYVYDISFSAAEWPTPKSHLDSCEGTAEHCQEMYRKNALSLEVYFEQLNYEVLKEMQAYQWVNLMADFGGQLGLWMGVSMITIMEVLVLAYQFLKLCCVRVKPPPKADKDHRRSIYDNSTVEMTIKIHPSSENETTADSINNAYSEEEYEQTANAT
uniref:Degenerin mec-10 n=1 Tax=Trichuris muris TaxID=70415 RepID=A0A5S6QZI3_TRIMR